LEHVEAANPLNYLATLKTRISAGLSPRRGTPTINRLSCVENVEVRAPLMVLTRSRSL
jgi:hypothetical protein